MNEARLKLFNALHPAKKAFKYQMDWAADTSKFKLGVKARQIGITTSEAIDNFIECALWEESEESPTPPVIAFCSPSQRQSQRLMHYIHRARVVFEELYNIKINLIKEREDWMYFDTRAEIWSLPNNPRTVEGLDLSKGIIDEVGNFVGKEDQEIYDALMASLAAKDGSMVLFGKPRGRRGLFWKLYDPFGEYSKNFSVHKFLWTCRAQEDEQYGKAVAEHRKRMMDLSFRENYECEFVDEMVVVMPYELLDRASNPIEQWTLEKDFDKSYPVYMGVDFAKKIDETAVTLVEHGQKTIVRFCQTTQDSFDKQVHWLCKILDKFKPVKCIVDETGQGLPLLDILKSRYASRIEGVIFTNPTKEKLVLNARNLLDDGSLILPDSNKDLIDQLHGIEREILESGKSKYTGKRTETDWKDDMAWSLFLALSQLGESDWSFTIAETNLKRKITREEMFLKDIDDEGNPL